jgi:DivIVA domain-containing protein
MGKGAFMNPVGSARPLRPDEIRRKNFTVRFRGFDSNEVRGFLNAVADDLARLSEQVTTLAGENGRLGRELQHTQDELQYAEGELKEARANPVDQVTDQAVLLLDQAQQLADALIDEGMQSARDLLIAARHQQRDIIEPDHQADNAAVSEAMSTANHVLRHNAPASSDVEDVRMFAKVAQVQFRAVLDALDEQVSRLGQFSGTADRLDAGGDQEWQASPRPRRSELNPYTVQ